MKEKSLIFVSYLSDEHTMELGPDSDEQFPDPPSSQLARWKPLSLSEVQVCQLAKPHNVLILLIFDILLVDYSAICWCFYHQPTGKD